MTKSLKAQLQEKAEANTQRHRDASYRDDFDIGRQHTKLPLDKISPNPFQPRTSFPEEEIRELAVSITAVGLLQPITVRSLGDDRYELIAGERRLRAHKLLQKPTIECLVIAVDDATSATLALAENIEREDLSDFEIGNSIKRLEEHFPKRTKLAESLGIQRSDLYRYLSFSELPEFIQAKLAIAPKLLSRSAASDVVKVIKEIGENTLTARLVEAWSLLELGKLDQTKFAAYLAASAAQGDQVARLKPTHILRHGTKVGTFSRTPKEFVMKLSSATLTEDQVEKLQRFVLDLLE